MHLASAKLTCGQRDWNNKVGFMQALLVSSVCYSQGKSLCYPNPNPTSNLNGLLNLSSHLQWISSQYSVHQIILFHIITFLPQGTSHLTHVYTSSRVSEGCLLRQAHSSYYPINNPHKLLQWQFTLPKMSLWPDISNLLLLL